MKVKLLVSRGGLDFSQTPGDVIEVSPEEARRMEAEGQCTPLEAYPKTAEEKPKADAKADADEGDKKPAKKPKTAEEKP